MKSFLRASSGRASAGLALALGVALSFSTQAAHAENQKIVYAMPNVATSQSFAFVADAMGFWKKRGLDVDMTVVAGSASSAAVIGGDVQFATSTGVTMLSAVAHKQPLISIASLYHEIILEMVISNEAAAKSGLTLKNSTVQQRAQALKGLSIAIDNPSSVLDGFTKHIAVVGGLDPTKDITTVPMQPPATLAALESKRIDGFSMPPPWTTLAAAKGAGVIWISGPRGDLPDLSPFAFATIITRVDYCEKNPQTCRSFVAGVKEAMDFMKAEPEKSLAIVAPKFKDMDPQILKENFEQQRSVLQPGASFSEVAYKNTQQLDIDAGILKPSEARDKFEGALYTNAYLN